MNSIFTVDSNTEKNIKIMCWEINNEYGNKTMQMGIYKEKRKARDKYKGKMCVKTGNGTPEEPQM
jgi:hypothetical protein